MPNQIKVLDKNQNERILKLPEEFYPFKSGKDFNMVESLEKHVSSQVEFVVEYIGVQDNKVIFKAK